MASRLFHAIVGVGVSLGVAAGCGANMSGITPEGVNAIDASNQARDSALNAKPETAAPTPIDASAGDAKIELPVDASSHDAALIEPPHDALLDAFCDVVWPTTKGNPAPPACVDPNHECTPDAGYPQGCYVSPGPYQCSYNSAPATSQWCVLGKWQCPDGKLAASDCKCPSEIPAGYQCTPDGLRPIADAQTHPDAPPDADAQTHN